MSDDPPHRIKTEQRDLSRINTETREQRREEAERDWRKQPIKKFLDLKSETLLSEDLNRRRRIIQRFEQYLLAEVAPRTEVTVLGVRDTIEQDIKSFIQDVLVPDNSISDRTIKIKLQDLSHFYSILNEYNAFAGNPVIKPLRDFRQGHSMKSTRPYIPFSRMQVFLNWLTYPFSRSFWLCGLKHGTRISEVVNIDLRCLHIAHPIFYWLINDHNVSLDPRVRNNPDTMVIYAGFNRGDEVPNETTPGPETKGEVRDTVNGNKRKEEGGSILPIDSELKTALIEWLLLRPPSYNSVVNPLFIFSGTSNTRRPAVQSIYERLWAGDYYKDSIQNFAAEEALSECPDCGGPVAEENPAVGSKTGRGFQCNQCRIKFWRSIYWDGGLKTSQKVTYHQTRHYFSNAHSQAQSDLHAGVIPDRVRRERIRGDANQTGDTESAVYIDSSYEQYDKDIRTPYLNGIYKFDLYDTVIPAVGEGWSL